VNARQWTVQGSGADSTVRDDVESDVSGSGEKTDAHA
jgi:hypothetical protein